MLNLFVYVDISRPAQSLNARKYFTELFKEFFKESMQSSMTDWTIHGKNVYVQGPKNFVRLGYP